MIKKIKIKIYKLLRQSQKYTKTDMVYLAKGGFWLTLGQFVASISVLLLAVAFANLLPKETYGTYKYILSIVGILAIPSLSGMGTAIVQAVARGYEGSLVTALKTKIRWGLLGSLASLALAGYYYCNDNSTFTIAFLISAAFLPFMSSFGIYGSFLQGKKLFNVSTTYSIISQITAVGVLISALFFTQNLFLILLAYFVSWTILRFIFLKSTFKKFQPNRNEDPQTISYGKHLSLVRVVGTIASHLDKILIFHYLGAVELSIYFFAIAPIEQIKGLFKNLPILALPKLSQRSFKEINDLLYKRIFQLFLMGATIAGIYILLAPYFFKIFFPQYIDSVFFSRLYAVAILIMLPYTLSGSARVAKLTITPKKILYLANLPSLILILFLVLLTERLGITGVILSRIISLISGFTVSLIIWGEIGKIE